MNISAYATKTNVYIYLDKDGIESLFAQTSQRLETELKEISETSRNEKVGGKLGIGKALAVLLGIEIGVDAETSKGRKGVEEITSSLAIEQKLVRLQNYLSASSSLSSDLVTAMDKSLLANEPAFFQCLEEFDLPQFYGGKDGVGEANADGGIIFKARIKHLPTTKVIMTASLTKFPRVSGGTLGNTSHEAMHFRGMKGRGLPLRVFGYLKPLGKEVFQIKPYAIWL